MSQDEFNINEKTKVTIRRGKHDKENPYFIISRSFARDVEMKCRDRGILVYLLSLPDDWIVHPLHIAKCLGISKGTMYDSLKNLIRLGYAKKVEVKNSAGQFDTVNYYFFEERQEVSQEIKEKSTLSKKRETEKTVYQKTVSGFLDTYDIDIYTKEHNNSLKVLAESDQSAKADRQAKACDENLESSSKNEKPKKKRIDDLPPEVHEVADHFIDCLKKAKPNYLPPRNLSAFLTQIDLLLRLDKRSREIIIQVLSWALADSFWCAKLYKQNPAEYLRKNFDQLEMAMNSKHTAFKSFPKVDRRTKNQDGTPVDAPHLKDLF